MHSSNPMLDPAESVQPNSQAQKDQKMQGFIVQRTRGYHALRLRIPMGHLTSGEMPAIAAIAEKYGRGVVHLTVRLGIEIPWIKTGDLEKAKQELLQAGIVLAGCGPRTRSIHVCKGDVCPYSVVDTYKLGTNLDERYFSTDNPEIFPHKFKIGASGCPNACSKPQFNDIGLIGITRPTLIAESCSSCGLCADVCLDVGGIDNLSQAWAMLDAGSNGDLPVLDESKCIFCGDCIRVCPTDAIISEETGLALFIGGKFGRRPMMGFRVANFLTEDEAFAIIDKTKEWWKENGKRGERLGTSMLRVGLAQYKEDVLTGSNYAYKLTNFEDKGPVPTDGTHWTGVQQP